VSHRDPFVDQVLGLLMSLGPVRARAMFGGHGIYLEDIFFAIIGWDRLWLRVDEETKSRFAEAGNEPFVYDGKTRPVELAYWAAPEGSMENPETLLPWADLAARLREARFGGRREVAAARRVKAAKKSKKRKATKR